MGNGLEGLGALNENSVGGMYKSPNDKLAKHDTDPRLLKVYPEQFANTEQYANYIKKYFIDTGVFNVFYAESSLITATGLNIIFTVSFLSDTNNIVYNIVPAFNMQVAKQYINAIYKSGLTKAHSVIFAFTSFSQNDKNIAKKLNTELVSPTEMYEINNAITSFTGGLTFTGSFVSKISKELHNKYKDQINMKEQIMGGASNIGGDLTSSFKDAGEQLKSSFSGLAGSLGFNKNKQCMIGSEYPNNQQMQLECRNGTFGQNQVTFDEQNCTDAENFMNNPIIDANIHEQSYEDEMLSDMDIDEGRSINPLDGINNGRFGDNY